ncbi:MAG TPA: ergothioneine biosynthesis protein EgtB [Gemmatimonadota bacterium]|jgi:iron(II)-dependent oxidoreductase
MTTGTRPIDEHVRRFHTGGAAPLTGERWAVHFDGTSASEDSFAHSVARGLSDHPRWLHCRYLYDEAGSRIFSAITEQPEYYLTGAESEILAAHADEIRALVGAAPIVELGAGSGTKTRYLLDAWSRAADGEFDYLPIDIDSSVLTGAARELAAEHERLVVTGLATSYERGLDAVAHVSPLCLVFLGSTIGNFNPDETDAFLARLERTLAPDDSLLLGIDLVKDVATLEAAYDDAGGWSRRFTRNLFARMNRELGTDVDVESIDHVAYWNDRLERIEIYARFRRATRIELPSIGRSFRVAAGEMILTEISRKYRIPGMTSDLARFGFAVERVFTDAAGRFGLLLCRRIQDSPGPDLASRLAGELQATRLQTLAIIESLSDEQLAGQVSPILSPIAWDLGHMAEFEELWLVRTIDGLSGSAPPTDGLERIYDAVRTPRAERGELDLPDRVELLRRMRLVRRAALARLRALDLDAARAPLLEGGFVYRMLSQHEAQHQETILQAVALMNAEPFEPAHRIAPPRAKLPPDTDMVVVPGGRFPAGTATAPGAYDNERPVHWVDVRTFWIDTAPVTTGAWLDFMDDGGYARRELWSDDGWAWLSEEPCEHPLGWTRGADGWLDVQFGHVEPLVLARPVQHVSWYEADAYARWAGKRLPTELEWEKAAAWDPELRIARTWPWGDMPPDAASANLGASTYAPAPVGAYPRGRSFYGCHQMIGDVWEWTASEFLPYPGFESFPYAEYSEVHFGKGYRVLRGGSWATAPIVARNTFRNWDLPQRRQIFAGLRCARDA